MHKFQSNPLVSEYPAGPDASLFKGILLDYTLLGQCNSRVRHFGETGFKNELANYSARFHEKILLKERVMKDIECRIVTWTFLVRQESTTYDFLGFPALL